MGVGEGVIFLTCKGGGERLGVGVGGATAATAPDAPDAPARAAAAATAAAAGVRREHMWVFGVVSGCLYLSCWSPCVLLANDINGNPDKVRPADYQLN